MDSFSASSDSDNDFEKASESEEPPPDLEPAFSFFFSDFFATKVYMFFKAVGRHLNVLLKTLWLQQTFFRFRDEFSTVKDFHFSVWPAVWIRFLVLHSLNYFLARDYMAKNHMDTKNIIKLNIVLIITIKLCFKHFQALTHPDVVTVLLF